MQIDEFHKFFYETGILNTYVLNEKEYDLSQFLKMHGIVDYCFITNGVFTGFNKNGMIAISATYNNNKFIRYYTLNDKGEYTLCLG